VDILKPPALTKGDTVGIFTPSHPAYVFSEEKFLLGYKVKLGTLTNDRSVEGYRSGTGKARAEEFMSLYKDLEVKLQVQDASGSSGIFIFC
jgi:muramoyltetrapeptide carboxypeptidase LdcA involved in peptidoglycan recycling